MAGRWSPSWARRGERTRTRVHRCRPARAATAVASAAGATATPSGLTTDTCADSGRPAGGYAGDTQTDLARLGVTRVGGIGYGPDGSLLVLDSQSRSIVTVPGAAQPGQVSGTPLESAPASRPTTSAQVNRSRAAWDTRSAAALVVRGNGERTAEAFEGGKPAVLHIEYRIP